MLTAVVAGGHALIEDFPGLGKTLAARSFAQALGLDFRRAQFTPDLLPADLTGSYVYDQSRSDFVFRPGPVFAGFLLADEINRTPPKTQAALLEAMQERQVTVEGTTHALPSPFHVMATANPIETEGTYPLPEAQLDRFLLRLRFGYPDEDAEWEVLRRRIERRREEVQIEPVLDAEGLRGVQAAAEGVFFHPEVGRYAVALTAATRQDGSLLVGASPRGSLALLACARAYALIRGRDFVTPDDVKLLAVPALAHRVTVRPELWLSNVSAATVIEGVVSRVPVPTRYLPDA
ncbi:MoxR family ATPase [Microbacterium fluvii]